QRRALVDQLLARGQGQVGLGFRGGESISKSHWPLAGAARAVSAQKGQSHKAKACSSAVAAAQFARSALGNAGSEFSEAGETGIFLRMNSERSRPVEVAFGLADEQHAAQDRDHRA